MRKGLPVSIKGNKLLTLSTCLLLFIAVTFLLFSVNRSEAQSGPVLQLTPSQGMSGTIVSVYGLGFPSGGSVSIDFGERHMTNSYPGMFGRINTAFTVPAVSYGSYTVTATGSNGVSASATFMVTSVSSSSTVNNPAPTYVAPNQGSDLTGSSFGFTSIPTQAPIKAKAGFWSPVAIGAVAAVIAIGVLFPTVFIIRRRRSSDLSTFGESPPSPITPSKPSYAQSSLHSRSSSSYSSSLYRSSSTYPQRKATPGSTYRSSSSFGNQVISQRPVIHHRYNGSASTSSSLTSRSANLPYRPGQPTGYSSFGSTRTCPHCKHTIKTDYSVCPYCRKRL